MGTLQNITTEGLLSILGISGYNGIAVAKSQTTATTLVITVTQPAYAMLGDGIILTSELVNTTVEDLSTDGDYHLYLDYEDVYEGRDVVWTVATSAPSPAALLIADVTVAENTISDVTLLRSTPLPSALTQPVAFTPPPPLSEWTWVNQGPYDDPADWPLLVTAADIPGGIRFTVPGPTNWPAVITANDPLPDPPYTITMAFRLGLLPDQLELTIAVRDSDTGDAIVLGILYDLLGACYSSEAISANITPVSYTQTGTFSIGKSMPPVPIIWLRLQNDGSRTHIFTSNDGLSFIELGSIDSSNLVDMNQHGIYFWNSSANYDSSPHLEVYDTDNGQGHTVIDLLSIEVVPELVVTTPFV